MVNQDQLLSVVDQIYEAVADPERWPVAIESLLDRVGAASGGLHFLETTSRIHANVVPRTDPVWTSRYRERWMGCTELERRIAYEPVGRLYTFDTLGLNEDFERSAFYNEFLSPQGEEVALGTTLFVQGSAFGSIIAFRSKERGPFDSREAKVFASISPHLRRAVYLHLRLSELKTRQTDLTAALDRLDQGALLVTADARLLFANRAAEAILTQMDGLRLEHGCLTARSFAKTTTLRRLIAASSTRAEVRGRAEDRDPVVLPRGDERTPLSALVLPLPSATDLSWPMPGRPAAIVFLRDPERALSPPSARQLAALFGLTSAQAALALEVTRGEGGLRAAAERLGIAHATARAHLAAVFEKTGARTQAELVRLLLGCGISLRMD